VTIERAEILERKQRFSDFSSNVQPVTVRGARTLWYFLQLLRDPIDCVRTVTARHGPFVVFESFNFHRRGRTILAVGPEYNKAILGDPLAWRSAPMPISGPKGTALDRLSHNLVSLNGPRHAYYRKLLSQPIRSTNIDQLGAEMGRFVASAVASWPQGAVDLWPLAQGLMRSVAIALLFGGDQVRGAALADQIGRLIAESKSPWTYLCRAGLPGKAFKRVLDRAESVERCALDFAATKRGVRNEHDLLSLLVNSPDETGAEASLDLIASQIPVLFGASYETCQTALTWTLFLLAQHPRVAKDLVDEVSAALGGTPLTLSKVARLPLLDAVVRESMRILPPVPNQSRTASQPTHLGGYEVMPGTSVVLSAFLTNRLPDLYDEPARFKPERWSRINPSTFEYLAFSGGPRVCPGFWFGTGVVKVAIAAIVSRFRVSVVRGTKIDRLVTATLAPRSGLQAILHPADGAWAAVPVTGQICDMVEMSTATSG
jgi:cytochrome P450